MREANLRPSGAPPSRGRRVRVVPPLPLEGGCPKGRGLAPTDDSWRFSLSVILSEAEGSLWQEGKG